MINLVIDVLNGFYPVYDAERGKKSDSGAGTSYWSCEDEEDP